MPGLQPCAQEKRGYEFDHAEAKTCPHTHQRVQPAEKGPSSTSRLIASASNALLQAAPEMKQPNEAVAHHHVRETGKILVARHLPPMSG
jgi:hypothetical protein